MRRTRMVAAAVCAGLLVSGVAVAAASPAPAPTGQHAERHDDRGKLLSSKLLDRMTREQAADYLAEYDLDAAAARHGVDLYLVTYRTVDADGRRTTASTLSVIPRSSDRTLRTVAWLHGTRIYRGYTGSMDDNTDRAAAVQFAAAGYATVAPDYLGLGVGPGHHPYMISKPTVTATVDSLRATRTLASRLDRRLDRRVLVTGFSQGGQASMLVGRALQRPGGEFALGGIAAIAGPHAIRREELPAALDGRLDGVSASLYLGYAMTSWDRFYPLYEQAVGRLPRAVRQDRRGPLRRLAHGGGGRRRTPGLAAEAVHRPVPRTAGQPQRDAAPGARGERRPVPVAATRAGAALRR